MRFSAKTRARERRVRCSPIYNGANDSVGIAVINNHDRQRSVGPRDISHVAVGRSDEKDRNPYSHHVVDLAWVYQASHGFSQNNKMQIRRRKRSRKLREGLIGQTENVAATMPGRELANLYLLAAAPNETEADVPAGCQPERRIENRVERMDRTVISRVHDNVFPFKPVFGAERLPARFVVPDCVVVRPRRQGCYFGGGEAFRDHTVPHETVQSDDAVGGFGTEPQRRIEDPGNCGVGLPANRPRSLHRD